MIIINSDHVYHDLDKNKFTQLISIYLRIQKIDKGGMKYVSFVLLLFTEITVYYVCEIVF